MRIASFILLAVAGTALIGCEAQPTEGVVGWPGPSPIAATPASVWRGDLRVGSLAPDFPFTSPSGRQTTLDAVRQPITIVGFVTSPAGSNSWLSPQLVALAERFWDLPITVAQVSLPDGGDHHEVGNDKARQPNRSPLVVLHDPNRVAWNAYGRPKDNTVILIDDERRVVAIGDLEDLPGLAGKAEDMAKAIKDADFVLHSGA